MYQVYVAFRNEAGQIALPDLPHPNLVLSDAWGQWMEFTWSANSLTHHAPEDVLLSILNAVYSGNMPCDSPVVRDMVSFMSTMGSWLNIAAWRVEPIQE